jgi:hypothetical protein
MSEQVSADLKAAIEQLSQAIRQASETGARNLPLPDDD